MRQIKDGDYTAFEQVFRSYYPRLLRYALRFIADEDEAKDAVQHCFVQLWERRGQLQFVSLQSLLFAMVRNRCLNVLKHDLVRQQYEQTILDKTEGEERLYNFDFYNDADHSMLYDELRQKVDGVIASLPARTQEIFRMSRFDGMKNREIAEQLGISLKVVERHISKALAAFRSLQF